MLPFADSFEVLLNRIKEFCAWETIPHKEIVALAAICAPADVATLIQELEALDDDDLVNDAGDISDEYWRLRNSLADVLARVGQPAVTSLIQALTASPNPQTRAYCAKALGEIGDPRAFEPICILLAREDDKISFILALGNLKDKRAVEILLPYLAVPPSTLNRAHIVSATATALGQIATEQVIEPLINVLREDKDWYARLGVVEALSGKHDPRVIDALREAANDPDARVRTAANRSLS